ncbi:YceD family protein [Mangrovicoccus algicola]|uniref:DUF177 domain-containing protein n=1 Tax=Mangrovicoccus algicola TaxID=2771008 RepID=A0A8J6YPN2_9RHOB|nr:DUF177 domain-containing protein [Mangrovicoccus algicola]MBE3637143.1 DUF177 domain-containing protein [Mangrovicoccus algicola]
MSDSSESRIDGTQVVLSRLPREGAAFSLQPSPEVQEALRADLGLDGLRKLRFEGRLLPEGKRDWRLEAHLGATVIQPCTVTLAPVTTRLEEDLSRRYLADWQDPETGAETEMPEDDTAGPLPRQLDLAEVMHEALALALPLYPRAEGAGFADTAVTEPGKAPMTDEEAKPFAGLAALRGKLADGGDDGDSGEE